MREEAICFDFLTVLDSIVNCANSDCEQVKFFGFKRVGSNNLFSSFLFVNM